MRRRGRGCGRRRRRLGRRRRVDAAAVVSAGGAAGPRPASSQITSAAMAPSATRTGIDTRRRGASAAERCRRGRGRGSRQAPRLWVSAPRTGFAGAVDGPRSTGRRRRARGGSGRGLAGRRVSAQGDRQRRDRHAWAASTCACGLAMTGRRDRIGRSIVGQGQRRRRHVDGRPLASQNSRRFCALVATSGSSAGRVRAAMAWARRYSRSAASS